MTFRETTKKCAMCGKDSEQHVIMSYSIFETDLDTRPRGMFDEAAFMQECEHCGYVGPDISEDIGIDKEFIASEEYQYCDFINFIGIKGDKSRAEKFYKYYLINKKLRNYRYAFKAILQAAWMCDDEDDPDNAKICRELAIGLSNKILNDKICNRVERKNVNLIRVDLLRRTGQFDRVLTEYKRGYPFDKDANQILKFQRKKALEKDDKRHKLKEVKEEAKKNE